MPSPKGVKVKLKAKAKPKSGRPLAVGCCCRSKSYIFMNLELCLHVPTHSYACKLPCQASCRPADCPRAADHAPSSGVDETIRHLGCKLCCANLDTWVGVGFERRGHPRDFLLLAQEVTMAVSKAATVSLWEDAVWLLEAIGVSPCFCI